jgi:hypothetical protein
MISKSNLVTAYANTDASLAAWKVARIAHLAKLRRKKLIGARLHAKAVKATAALKSLDEGVALVFLAHPGRADSQTDTGNDDEEKDLAVDLHVLLASDAAIGEDPAYY